MKHPRPVQNLFARGAVVAAFNTALAAALTIFGRHTWWDNLGYSMAIGLSIWLLIEAGLHKLVHELPRDRLRVALIVPTGVLLGYLGGTLIGDLVVGQQALHFLANEPRQALGFLGLSLVAGVAATAFFTNQALLAEARLAREAAQRQASEARLRLLASQLEPHMLFNTLANLRVLIEADSARAVDMLDRLNGYLRATLAASRADGSHTLALEFLRLSDYLALMAVRMGPRLRHRLDLPEALAAQPVPPLLLQPLVENAIRHGLEPSVQGGEVRIEARALDGRLCLCVEDSGVGHDGAVQDGFGLSQVRERLTTAFGPDARLDWHSAPGQGTRVTLTLPLNPAPTA